MTMKKCMVHCVWNIKTADNLIHSFQSMDVANSIVEAIDENKIN